jgi:hypothetical protein
MDLIPDALCHFGVPAHCRSRAEAGAFPVKCLMVAGPLERTGVRHSLHRTRSALPSASAECLSRSEGLPPVRCASAWLNSPLGEKISKGFSLEAVAWGCSHAAFRFDGGTALGGFRLGPFGVFSPGVEPPNVGTEIRRIDDAPGPIIDISVEAEALCQPDIIEKSGCVVHCGLPPVLSPIVRDGRENPKLNLFPPELARHQRRSGGFCDVELSICERDCRGRETSEGFRTANPLFTWTMNKIPGWWGQQDSPDGTHKTAFSIFAVVADNVLAGDAG